MKPTSIRLDEDTLDILDSEAEERGISRNRRIRDVLENRGEYRQLRADYSQLEDEYEQLQNEHDQLQDEYAEYKDMHNAKMAEYYELKAENGKLSSKLNVARVRDEKLKRLEEERDEAVQDRKFAEAERDDLRRQLQAVTSKERNVDELVEYVEEERAIQQRREQRERERRQANALRRAWWWLAGEPGDDADG
jgi:chromosome segregation ATPase